MLYLVPTFGNPTGRSLAARRREALVAVARRGGIVIVEDDTYRELAFEVPAPTSLLCHDADDVVVRLGSFSKSVAPGIRLGWITAARDRIAAFGRRGFVDSGGGLNHATALAMAEFGASGRYAGHLDTVRRRYAAQRDALVAAVRTHLPDATFEVPGGGWFLWVGLPDAAVLLPHAERHGVSYLPGATFFARPAGRDRLRLSYSLYEAAELDEAVRRLAAARAAAAGGRIG